MPVGVGGDLVKSDATLEGTPVGKSLVKSVGPGLPFGR